MNGTGFSGNTNRIRKPRKSILNAGETVKFEIEYDDGSIIKLLGKVNLQGEVKIENVKLNQKQESK